MLLWILTLPWRSQEVPVVPEEPGSEPKSEESTQKPGGCEKTLRVRNAPENTGEDVSPSCASWSYSGDTESSSDEMESASEDVQEEEGVGGPFVSEPGPAQGPDASSGDETQSLNSEEGHGEEGESEPDEGAHAKDDVHMQPCGNFAYFYAGTPSPFSTSRLRVSVPTYSRTKPPSARIMVLIEMLQTSFPDDDSLANFRNHLLNKEDFRAVRLRHHRREDCATAELLINWWNNKDMDFCGKRLVSTLEMSARPAETISLCPMFLYVSVIWHMLCSSVGTNATSCRSRNGKNQPLPLCT